MPANDTAPPIVFISHSTEDTAWCNRIIHHLAPLEKGGHIRTFTNACDDSEGEWNNSGPTEEAMGGASVALLLLSPDSLGCQSFRSFDGEFFVNKATYGEVILIPLLLFNCEWRKCALFAPLRMFSDARPLADLEPNERDAALDSLARAIVASTWPMFPTYFATEFRISPTSKNWPTEFVIVTAYAPTGEQWTDQQNKEADEALEQFLKNRGGWLNRIIGFNPTTGHTEPGWAFEMPFNEACDLGRQYLQDAIYHVQDDQLSVTYCDERRGLVPVGKFRERVHVVA